MPSNDDDLFRLEMADVTPIKPDGRADPGKPQRKDNIREQLRRAAAVDDRRDNNPLTVPEQVEPIGPLDIIGVKKNGVQEGVYRKLRLGKYEAQDSLDLHRVRLMDARNQVHQFLTRAHENSLRAVLISHGKGLHSERPGFLKSYVMHWLHESQLVLAYHTAPANRGGTGATFVLIRKNSQARQRNREFFMEAGKNNR